MWNGKDYSIKAYHRYAKVVFFLPHDVDEKIVPRLINFCTSRWGGRTFPMFITDGHGLSDVDLKTLKEYDPDFIHSYVHLEPSFIDQLTASITPCVIEETDDLHSIHDVGGFAEIPFTSSAFGKDKKLVLFDTKELKDDSLEKFLQVSFGNSSYLISFLERIGSEIHHVFKINDRNDFKNALLEIVRPEQQFIYPIQFSGLWTGMVDVKTQNSNESFKIFTGNTLEDIVEFWNYGLYTPKWKRSFLSSIWLPSDIFTDKVLHDIIFHWLHTLVWGSCSEKSRVQVISKSLDSTALLELETTFRTYDAFSLFLELNADSFIRTKVELYLEDYTSQSFRGLTNEEVLVLQPPSFIEDFDKQGHWMVELDIELKSSAFDGTSGIDYSYKLPVDNVLSQDFLPHMRSRITSLGRPAALVRGLESAIKLRLPGRRCIFHQLLGGVYNPYYKNDVRTNLQNPSLVPEFNISDAGRNLSAVISFCGGLSKAYYLFESKFWREMFGKMACKAVVRQKSHTKKLKTDIKQRLVSAPLDISSEDSCDYWASQLISMMKHLQDAYHGSILSYQDFYDEAKECLEHYNRSNHSNYEFLEEQFKDKIQRLLQSEVLLLGTVIKCPYCLHKQWLHVSDMSQRVSCSSCSFEVEMPVECVWHYNINGIISMACNNDIVPNILVLGAILRGARRSFLYYSPVDVSLPFARRNTYESVLSVREKLNSILASLAFHPLVQAKSHFVYNYINKVREQLDDSYASISIPAFPMMKKLTDLDVVCVVDGRFTIGEVKKSVKNFNFSDFDKISYAAHLVQPDKVIFASLDSRSVPPQFKEKFNEVKQFLGQYEIDVEWFDWRYSFANHDGMPY